MAPAPDTVPLIVVGASAGGLEALAALLRGVSPSIPASILVVVHVGASEAQLPRYFEHRSPLPVRYARDGETIDPGTVLVASPDRHLIVSDGHVHLGTGPKENHTRPAIDPLFRSAAEAGGPLVMGVILTGHLTDGTAGMWEIKRRGGKTIVQNPDEAVAPSMPRSAFQHVDVDYCLNLEDIGDVLNQWAVEAARKAASFPRLSQGEADVSYTADSPRALTCPDCGGAVRKVRKGTYNQFQCHIGHTFGTPEMAMQQFTALENQLNSTLRLLNERRELCSQAATDARLAKREQDAILWDAAAEEAGSRFNDLAGFLEADWHRPELASVAGKLEQEEVLSPRSERNRNQQS